MPTPGENNEYPVAEFAIIWSDTKTAQILANSATGNLLALNTCESSYQESFRFFRWKAFAFRTGARYAGMQEFSRRTFAALASCFARLPGSYLNSCEMIMTKRLIAPVAVLLIALGSTARGEVRVFEKPADDGRRLVLESDRVQVVVWPAAGGAITDFVNRRTGTNFVAGEVERGESRWG